MINKFLPCWIILHKDDIELKVIVKAESFSRHIRNESQHNYLLECLGVSQFRL